MFSIHSENIVIHNWKNVNYGNCEYLFVVVFEVGG